MKKQLLLLSVVGQSLTMTAFLTNVSSKGKSVPKAQNLVGRWQHTLATGGVWVWAIRPNGTFSVSSKGKEFANGHYRVTDGIYDVNDANCHEAYHGRYRFAF